MLDTIDISYVQKFFLTVVLGLSMLLGIGVLLANFKLKTNRTFFLMVCSFSTLLITAYLIYYPGFERYANFFGKLNFASVAITLASILFFVFNYPQPAKKYIIWEFIAVLAGYIIAIFSIFTPFLVKETVLQNSSVKIHLGDFQYVLYFYTISVIIVALGHLIKTYRVSEKKIKVQILFPLIGAVLVAIFNIIFNIVIPSIYADFDQFWIGDYSIFLFLLLTAYAIMKYEMFNIKIVVTEVSVLAVSLILFIQIFLDHNFTQYLISGLIWLAATYGGWILIKSIQKEIKQKEELELLAKKLEEANLHLKDLDRMKDDFLGMASHELNTPLAAIEGYLSMILEEGMGGELQPQTREYLNRIFSSSQRLSAIVKDLLNVSRIESGRIHLLYAEVQIEELIKQAVAEIDPKVKEKKHTTCLELPANPLPKSWFDPTRITEVLLNLLGNAVKYTDDSGHIEIGAKQKGKDILIWVKDNGKGIPKDRADRVFAKFTQVDVLKDEVKGTGLGMYISQKFVELHKGKIWFESSGAGKGTTFFVSLPIVSKKPYDPNEGDGPILH